MRSTCNHSKKLFLSAPQLSDVYGAVKVTNSLVSKHEGIEVINNCGDGCFRSKSLVERHGKIVNL